MKKIFRISALFILNILSILPLKALAVVIAGQKSYIRGLEQQDLLRFNLNEAKKRLFPFGLRQMNFDEI